VKGRFDASSTINLTAQGERAIQTGTLQLFLSQIGPSEGIKNLRLKINRVRGTIALGIAGDDARIEFGEGCAGKFFARLWRKSTIIVGQQTTANSVRIACDQSRVIIGSDCMLSDNVLIQSADQHGIVDIVSGRIVNDKMRNTIIGDHVWLGRQSTVMPDVKIGSGSIAATGALVTSNIPPTSICAGIPARVVRTGATWSRSPTALDQYSATLVEAHRTSSAADSNPPEA